MARVADRMLRKKRLQVIKPLVLNVFHGVGTQIILFSLPCHRIIQIRTSKIRRDQRVQGNQTFSLLFFKPSLLNYPSETECQELRVISHIIGLNCDF